MVQHQRMEGVDLKEGTNPKGGPNLERGRKTEHQVEVVNPRSVGSVASDPLKAVAKNTQQMVGVVSALMQSQEALLPLTTIVLLNRR